MCSYPGFGMARTKKGRRNKKFKGTGKPQDPGLPRLRGNFKDWSSSIKRNSAKTSCTRCQWDLSIHVHKNTTPTKIKREYYVYKDLSEIACDTCFKFVFRRAIKKKNDVTLVKKTWSGPTKSTIKRTCYRCNHSGKFKRFYVHESIILCGICYDGIQRQKVKKLNKNAKFFDALPDLDD